jgi:hypothetical protein
LGVIGIVATAAWVSVASHYRSSDQTSGHVANAIMATLPHMAAGDVLLIEYQDSNNRPPELDVNIWDAIFLASATSQPTR